MVGCKHDLGGQRCGGGTVPVPVTPPGDIRPAFPFDIEMVRKSYKSLMLKYHPDKHAGDPQKQRIALEITKKINESFERIRARHEGGARG